MSPAHPTLGRFVLRTLLWLAPCFAAWYLVAAQHAAFTGVLAHALVDVVKPHLLSGVEREGITLVFVTAIEVRPAPGQVAVLLPQVNPLLYTYGLALFLALMLGARARWWKVLLGAAALLPFQAWGVAFDFLAQVGVKLGPEIASRAGLAGWRAEGIAIAYQLGALIFPAVVPVMAWALLERAFIAGLLRPRAAAPQYEAATAPPSVETASSQ